jgi:hypothetical protein
MSTMQSNTPLRILRQSLGGRSCARMPQSIASHDELVGCLRKSSHLVSLKTDGERAFVILWQDETCGRYAATCLAARTFEILQDDISFHAEPQHARVFDGTVLDVEVVRRGIGPGEFSCVLLDAPIVCGASLEAKPFRSRLRAGSGLARALGLPVSDKQWVSPRDIDDLIDPARGLPNDVDGLIFVPPLLRDRTLKWKPPHLRTVDLRWSSGTFLFMSDNGVLLDSGMSVHDKDLPDTVLEDGYVYECLPITTSKVRVVGRRDDKKSPNAAWVVNLTVEHAVSGQYNVVDVVDTCKGLETQ